MIDSSIILKSFLNKLGIKHTSKTLEYFENHPDSPSLLSIHQTFKKLGIGSMAMRISFHDLEHDLPKPCLIPIFASGGLNYLVLNKVENENLFITEDGSKETIIQRNSFEQMWTGTALIVETNTNTILSEENYILNKVIDIYRNSRIYLASLALLLTVSYSMFFLYDGLSYNYFFLITKIAGVIFTIPLMMRIFNDKNLFVLKLCSPNEKKKISCDSILDSDSARLLGLISWAEIGFIYFLIQFIFVLFFSSLRTAFILSVFSIFSFPYILYSIGYQWRIAKQWCKLCLFVQAVLMTEFILGATFLYIVRNSNVNGISLYQKELAGLTIISLTVIALYSFFKPVLTKYMDYKKQFGLTAKLKFDREFFVNTLSQQAFVNFDLTPTIGFGSPNGQHRITIITNPSCAPCIKMNRKLFNILKGKSNTFVTEYLFTKADKNDSSYHLGKAMLYLFDKSPDLAKAAAADYYNNYIGKYREWIKKYSLDDAPQGKYEAMLDEHLQWCTNKGFTSVPIIFYNGYKLPRLYLLEDFEYLID